MPDIFKYSDYITYIKAQIYAHQTLRGYRKKLAAAARCQPSYFSQALKNQVELTPDQVARLAEFWHLSEEESEYFLQLCYLSRCGSKIYKSLILRRMTEIQAQRQDLTKQLSYSDIEAESEALIYYCSWLPVALHILFSIPKVKTVEDAAKRLRVPVKLVEELVDKLVKVKMLEKKDSRINSLKAAVHLDKHSAFSSLHHLNWRYKVLESLTHRQADDFHYTGIHSLSAADLAEFKVRLNKLLADFNTIVKHSPEETVAVVVTDIFEL